MTFTHDYILESLRQAVPMLRNLAIRYHLDFDDLYQDAFLVALDCYERAMAYSNPRAFIQARLRWHALKVVRARSSHSALSLDAMLPELECSTPAADGLSAHEREQALYTALSRLTIQQQRALVSFYGLAAFQPQANGRRSWRAIAANPKAEWNRRDKAMTELRRDQALREATFGGKAVQA